MSQISDLIVTLTLTDKFSKPIGGVLSQLGDVKKAFKTVTAEALAELPEWCSMIAGEQELDKRTRKK